MNDREQASKKRHLIVTADDFGLSPEVNEGILKAFFGGIVTTASALVTMRHAKQAARFVQNIRMPVGLHLDLFEGEFPHDDEGLFGGGGFMEDVLNAREIRGERISLPSQVSNKIFREFWRQLCEFQDVFGRRPDHLSYHWGIHYIPDVLESYIRFASEEHIPFRYGAQYAHVTPTYPIHPDHWSDTFNGAANIHETAFLDIVRNAPEGIIEISTHPGKYAPDAAYQYNAEREKELEVLMSRNVADALGEYNVSLISFGHIPELRKNIE